MLDAVRPGGQVAAVVGHDWGASVAYGLAMRAPERMARLIIVNGVHPIPFQRELARGGAQTEASQYITWLRNPAADEVLAADDYARLLQAFSANMDMSWLAGDVLAQYKQAWSGPGTLRGMINWYRASPLVVPKPGEMAPDLPDLPVDAMRIRPKHLLIWGEGDTALLPESRAGLDDLCDDLTVRTFPDADHWIIHQKPDEVAALIADFAGPIA